jgi:threonine/homoserine/homoserine lactone efflux protein
MDVLILLAKGTVIGLVIAAPVGPIGFLCINRTLKEGPTIGLFTGLGAAAADAAYGAVAAFGLMQLAMTLSENQMLLRIVGGLALCVIGARSLVAADRGEKALNNPSAAANAANPGTGGLGVRLVRSFASAFLLTLANPATIFSFLAIFAALGWAQSLDAAAATLLVAGVFFGSAVWWLGLSSATGLLRGRMGEHQRIWIQRLSGAAIFGFGVFALLSVIV